MKKYEICITRATNIKFYNFCCNLCGGPLRNVVDDIDFIITNDSNFWDATSFILDESDVTRIQKIQIVSCFLYAGGNIEFDGHLYNNLTSYGFWKYLVDHKYISNNECDLLK